MNNKQFCSAVDDDVANKQRVYQEARELAEIVEKAAIVARRRVEKALEELNHAKALKPAPSPAPVPHLPAPSPAPVPHLSAPSPAPVPCHPVHEEILMAQEVEEAQSPLPPADTPPPSETKKEKKKRTNWSKGCPDDVPKDVHDEWLRRKKGSQSRFKKDWQSSQKYGYPIGMYKKFLDKKRRNDPPPYQRIDRGPNVICDLSDSSS